jgi:hypothetical protein
MSKPKADTSWRAQAPLSEDGVADQADTHECTIQSIMRCAAFAAGVRDVRAGRPPRFDEFYDDWSYERGRLWATLAPMSMPLRIGSRLNPKAVLLFYQHLEDLP